MQRFRGVKVYTTAVHQSLAVFTLLLVEDKLIPLPVYEAYKEDNIQIAMEWPPAVYTVGAYAIVGEILLRDSIPQGETCDRYLLNLDYDAIFFSFRFLFIL